jgi:hypothetical protein
MADTLDDARHNRAGAAGELPVLAVVPDMAPADDAGPQRGIIVAVLVGIVLVATAAVIAWSLIR